MCSVGLQSVHGVFSKLLRLSGELQGVSEESKKVSSFFSRISGGLTSIKKRFPVEFLSQFMTMGNFRGVPRYFKAFPWVSRRFTAVYSIDDQCFKTVN